MIRWKPYVAPGTLAVLAIAIYVWPIGSGEKPPAKADRYAGPEHQMRRAGMSAETPVVQIAVVDAGRPVETAAALPVLVGISGRTAWLKSANSGAVAGADVGDEVEGWTVTSVGPRRVAVKSGARTETLELFGG